MVQANESFVNWTFMSGFRPFEYRTPKLSGIRVSGIQMVTVFNRTTFRLVVLIRNLNEKVALLLGRPSKYCALVQYLEHGLNNGLITQLLTIWIPNWSDSDPHCAVLTH